MLVPQLFVQSRTESFDTLVQTLDLPKEELLKSYLPVILVHILPMFAVSKSQNATGGSSRLQRNLADATACYDSLVEQLGKEVRLVRKVSDMLISAEFGVCRVSQC